MQEISKELNLINVIKGITLININDVNVFRKSKGYSIQMNQIDNNFKINLNVLRLKSGLSMKKLSLKTGIARSNISSIESGKSLPGSLTLYKLSIALNCTMEDLISIEQ